MCYQHRLTSQTFHGGRGGFNVKICPTSHFKDVVQSAVFEFALFFPSCSSSARVLSSANVSTQTALK